MMTVDDVLRRAREPEPALAGAGSVDAARGAVLVLHGGSERSRVPAADRQVAVAWMRPVAHSLAQTLGPHGLAVWRLRFRYRGWNGDLAHPVDDVRWAMARLRERHGDVPVVLVGHSLGGRAAVRSAGEDGVAGVLGLAPWLPSDEPVQHMAGRRLLVVHGLRDRVTAPQASREYVERVRAAGGQASFVALRREGHAMIWRRPAWRRLAAGFVAAAALGLDSPAHVPIGRDVVL